MKDLLFGVFLIYGIAFAGIMIVKMAMMFLA